MKTVKHPVQSVVVDPHGTYRFKQNPVVRKFMEMAQQGRKYDMNDAAMDYGNGYFARNDMVQFAQLIGYSVAGWSDLSYVSDKDYEAAQRKVEKMKKRNGIVDA
jgi:hypothetical protein